jgi:hypothetical protein
MDLMKLSSVTSQPTELTVGESIEGYTRATWVERYREPGEFKIEAPLSSGLLEFLPEDSFVTHKDTSVLMIVENQIVKKPKGEDAKLEISGRCFTSWIANRILGDQSLTNEVTDYVLASDQTWDQVVTLINDHLVDPANTNGRLIGLDVSNTATGTVTVEERTLQVSDVHKAILDILKIDDLGIKAVRPTPTEPDIFYTVYRGVNVSTKVRFSYERGDLDNIEYLFSNKRYKNRAFVKGKWVQATINPGTHVNFDQRSMLVDGAFIDERQSAYPPNPARAFIIAALQITGDKALKAQTKVSITQADVSENTDFDYRKDYNLGDLVTVDGEFGASNIFRVTEFAETVDENGTTSHPTLAIPGES